jgi:hypothetical protein
MRKGADSGPWKYMVDKRKNDLSQKKRKVVKKINIAV